MLKWLKQKPMHGQGAMSTDKITDDPLATIQVHPNVKKSKNKSNEIYAVSRVNPLFEEEDPKSVFSPGNNSGSSGYDSGPSDDDIPGSPKYQQQTVVLTSTLSEAAPTKADAPGRNSNALSPNPPHLFRDSEDFVIHHEAALVGPDGHPVLQILQQNLNYVKSIAVSVPRRPLSPIEESHGLSENITSGNKSSNGPFRVNAMPVPQRTGVNNTEDSVGLGHVIQKNPKYVQSIRIGPSGGLRNQPGHLAAAKNFGEHKKLGRKPSVTFSERVDYLVEGNLHVPVRKNSVDHDSIVTDSLLQMTSQEDQFEHINGNWGTRKFSLVSDFNNRRARAGSSGSKGSSNNRGSTINTSSSENELEENKDAPDLEAFSNSMKKNRPIKSGLSPNRSLEEQPRPANSNKDGSGRTEDDDDGDHENDERSESSSASQQDSPVRPRTPRGNVVNGRSPFGGIADHYAAAKEIAREIDSYAIGSTKSTKRSLVRDLLLSSRGRGGSSSSNNVNQPSQDPAVKPLDGHTLASGKSHSSKSQQQMQYSQQQPQPPQQQQPQQQQLQLQQQQQQQQPRELVRVQQVYVKANSTQLSTSPQNEGQDHIQSNSQQNVLAGMHWPHRKLLPEIFLYLSAATLWFPPQIVVDRLCV
ncbi:unnamed protein product [Allacma fusca]|uniref:Uncharacterized protein n=1 Tax=Allacma fusca TaxID=39272 RepID=A0A8J2L2R4_9HEXA|nr:unnamed protein product [Allacma fusca]